MPAVHLPHATPVRRHVLTTRMTRAARRFDPRGGCGIDLRDMNTNDGLLVVAPQVTPVLDPGFRPAVLSARAFQALVDRTPGAVLVRVALEQADGSVFRFDCRVLPDTHPAAVANTRYLERFLKFLLWSRGGWRIYLDAPAPLAVGLAAHYADSPTGRFDAHLVGERMFDHPLAIVRTADLPDEQSETKPLGRHLEGCRIGFDLGGSDRQGAAVVGGGGGFRGETGWGPDHKPDPQYHFDGIMDSLQKAAAHMPRVDAIGGGAAGGVLQKRGEAGPRFL